MAHKGLEECFIRDPGAAEKPHHIGTLFHKLQQPFHGPAAQAPPLAADHDLQVFWDLAGQAQLFLGFEHPVKQLFLGAFIEPMAVDQAFLAPACLDPVTFKVIIALDEIGVVFIKELMRVFR